VATERQQSSYWIGRVVLNPASVESGNNKIVLREPAAKPLLHAAETKNRPDLADNSPDAIEQNRAAECSSAAILTVFTAGVHFSSVNLVHVLPPSTNDALPFGIATSNVRAESTAIGAQEWQGSGITVICVPSLADLTPMRCGGRPANRICRFYGRDTASRGFSCSSLPARV
jgi:hypothetical protein